MNSLFWFRRDLRLDDNTALLKAIQRGNPVLTVFIFDDNITKELDIDDPRISFIHDNLLGIDKQLHNYNSSLLILKGNPKSVLEKLVDKYNISDVYANKDYEPYALKRDYEIGQSLRRKKINFITYKDQVIFEENEISKNDGHPYTVYTPYKNKWLSSFKEILPIEKESEQNLNYIISNHRIPTLEELGFIRSSIKVKPFNIEDLDNYSTERNYPYLHSTSHLSPHLRFGTVSIRELTLKMHATSEILLSELIWREFFMQILYHYPKVVYQNFKSKYDGIIWRNNKDDFEKWCSGNTGFPMVDAGMRELNNTGYMHNRTRMITAGFLCKHLLIDWRWGEAYFASKLLDYELSSNNGNWQWAAGTGCDAAPYFRIFNPDTQLKKFDKHLIYVKKWIPEYGTSEYLEPMIDHKIARERALSVYKAGLG